MKFFAMILGFALATQAQTFPNATYRQQCGGAIYSKCDSAELNQKTIFEIGKGIAARGNKEIMLVVGADWCPACRSFDKMLESDKEAARLHQRFVVMNINGDVSSGEQLMSSLNVNVAGYPQAFILNASTLRVRRHFFPSQYHSVAQLLESFAPKTAVIPRPESLKEVKISTLTLPIQLNNDYGESPFIANPANDAEKFINQGVAALHVYHYVDAYRSFHMSEQLNRNSIYPQIGKLIALGTLSYNKDGDYFRRVALTKLDAISKARVLSPIERAWANFGVAYAIKTFSDFTREPGRVVMSLEQTYEDIKSLDARNLDGISLITWAGFVSSGSEKIKPVFEKVIDALPNNIGARHALLHIAEWRNDDKAAAIHAPILARLAPGSAHAQHMYGHTLPQQGRWAEAVAVFKRANELHQAWAKKYNLDPDQDWHNSHNLDLMAAAYLGLGDFESARQTWATALSDSRALYHYLELSMVTRPFAEVNSLFQELEKKGWAEYLKSYRMELELSPENAKNFKIEGEGSFERILQSTVQAFVSGGELPEVDSYFTGEFSSGGFDGWSNGYLELLRLKRVAKILSLDEMAGRLVKLESSAQQKVDVPAKSPIPCMESHH